MRVEAAPTVRVRSVDFGRPRHGVERYRRHLNEAIALETRISPATLRWSDRSNGPVDELVHVHVTDALLGPDDETRAHAVERVRALTRGPLVVTLHDLPTPADGRPFPVRRARYARMAEYADQVVVSSHHEAARLQATGATLCRPVVVVPHLLPTVNRRPPDPSGTVDVLGYLYPGKGHDDVVHALSKMALPPRFRALGAASPGHDDLPERLRLTGEAAGVSVEVTGWIGDAVLGGLLARAGCPVVPNHLVSASGSLLTWLAAGRRPLVRRGPFAEEVAAVAPDAIRCYDDPAELRVAVADSLADPASTVLPEPPPPFAPDRVARAHLDLYRELLACC